MALLTVGTFFVALLLVSSACTIALTYIDGNFDSCVQTGKWVNIPAGVADPLFYICLVWVAALQCIPKCFPLFKRRNAARVTTVDAREMQDVTHLGVPQTSHSSESSTSSSSSLENAPNSMSAPGNAGATEQLLGSAGEEEDSFDWNSCWMVFFCYPYYLGYDASIKASLVFGVDDAYRTQSISSTCGLDDHAEGNHEGLRVTEAIYKISPTIVRAWMLFFLILFVTVRRKRDPWLLASYCGCRSTARHGVVVRCCLAFIFLQCLQYTVQVYVGGLATKKQVMCSIIVLSLALLIFFYTLHILQVDLHPSRKNLRPLVPQLPSNYVWCTCCVLIYWGCGFLFYLNCGATESLTRNDRPYLSPLGNVSTAILYCALHAFAWVVFGFVSWRSKDNVFESQ